LEWYVSSNKHAKAEWQRQQQWRQYSKKSFLKCQQLSSITDFDETLLNKLHVILVAISCNHYVNSEKFRIFCEKTFDLYMHKYPWYPMSPTIHKVLVHGFQINNSTLVPLGCLGENVSEARNKIYKKRKTLTRTEK